MLTKARWVRGVTWVFNKSTQLLNLESPIVIVTQVIYPQPKWRGKKATCFCSEGEGHFAPNCSAAAPVGAAPPFYLSQQNPVYVTKCWEGYHWESEGKSKNKCERLVHPRKLPAGPASAPPPPPPDTFLISGEQQKDSGETDLILHQIHINSWNGSSSYSCWSLWPFPQRPVVLLGFSSFTLWGLQVLPGVINADYTRNKGCGSVYSKHCSNQPRFSYCSIGYSPLDKNWKNL